MSTKPETGIKLRLIIKGKLKNRTFSLDYDRNYGIDNRKGWSIAINGSYMVQLEPWLLVAVYKAVKKWPGYWSG